MELVFILGKSLLSKLECDMLNQINIKDTLWLKLSCEAGSDCILGVVYRKGDDHNHQ